MQFCQLAPDFGEPRVSAFPDVDLIAVGESPLYCLHEFGQVVDGFLCVGECFANLFCAGFLALSDPIAECAERLGCCFVRLLGKLALVVCDSL